MMVGPVLRASLIAPVRGAAQASRRALVAAALAVLACGHAPAPTADAPATSATPVPAPAASPARDADEPPPKEPPMSPPSLERQDWERALRDRVAERGEAFRACGALDGIKEIACVCRQICGLRMPPLPDGASRMTFSSPPLMHFDVGARGNVELCAGRGYSVACARGAR
jgi:hypothetical protein